MHHLRNGTGPVLTLLLAVALAAACSGDGAGSQDPGAGDSPVATSDGTDTEGDAPESDAWAAPVPIILNGQGNHLDAWSLTGGPDADDPDADDPDADDPDADGPDVAGGATHQRVLTSAAEDPDGTDVNAQLCVFERDGTRMLVAGEDTGQPDPPAGWGIFELRGDAIGDLGAEQVAKLTPTYQQADADKPENYGCGVLEDGRILTTDVGDQVAGANGQLILWFPPFDGVSEGDIAYCKLDVALPTAQSILVTGPEEFLVAAARGGVFRYTGPLPTGPRPEDGCEGTDATGRPLATDVRRTTLVEPGADAMVSPAGLAPAPDDGFYASSVFTGVINEYDARGTLRRTVLAPPGGAALGDEPYPSGTPLGLATDAEGDLWYADIGLVIDDGGVGPGDRTGTLRVIAFDDGEPSPPRIVADDLAFPDGVGTFLP